MDDGSIEIIVSDNASSDDSMLRVAELDPGGRIKTIRLPRTVSAIENWRIALGEATGKTVKLQLADDMAHPEATLRAARSLVAMDGVDFCVGKTVVSNEMADAMPSRVCTAYWNRVEASRKKISPGNGMRERGDLICDMIENGTVLGDINSWIFMREFIQKFCGITWGQPLMFGHPDFALAAVCLLHGRGVFLDEVLGTFTYNKTGPGTVWGDPSMRQMVYDTPTLVGKAWLLDQIANPCSRGEWESVLGQRVLREAGRSILESLGLRGPRGGALRRTWEGIRRRIGSWLLFKSGCG